MSDTFDKEQSLRLACDRCRAHKLRCPQNQTPIASRSCQRCLRAKVQCTFSPRARARKACKSAISTPEEDERRPRSQVTTTSAAEAFSDLEEHPSSIPELSQGSTTDFLDLEWMGYGNSITQPVCTKLDSRQVDAFKFDVNTVSDFADSADMGRVSFADWMADDINVETLTESNIEADSSMGDYTGEIDASFNASERAHLPTLSLGVPRGSFGRSSTPPLSIENSAGYWTQKLSTLAVAFYQQLERLNHGPWAKNPLQSGHSMGGYPIGGILQLSQELISVLLRISWDTSRQIVDVTTALLVLNCYVSLIRNYSVVFAHLGQYLRVVASLRLPKHTFHPSSGLLFEDLQPSNEAFNKTHAASQMLLCTLSRIEDILHLPREYRYAHEYRESATFDWVSSTPRSDIVFSDENCSTVETESSSSSDQSTAQFGSIVGDELLQAVLKREAMGGEGGAMMLLRKHVDAVKIALRQSLAL